MTDRELAELIAYTADRMYRCGAETRLIIQTSERVARAYGRPATVVVTPEMIGVKLRTDGENGTVTECSTFTRIDRGGLNMHNLVTYTRLCQEAEKGNLSFEELKQKLSEIRSYPYNPFLMTFLIGIATACFSFINGGDLNTGITAMLAGSITMAVKLLLQKYHLFDMFIFTVCGFTGTLSSYLIGTHLFELSRYNLAVAMVVSLLLLVPGFPFINGILDLFKGYISMGTVRLIHTIILVASVCLGIILAFSILPINGW